ncbi:putative bifunctional diguanylate cyclase/phosphodiesterase [Microvirga pudoricolor]|uniref:putative bifunctional diguanylate cyclase/phosphodiesterase n=1 Tax=Microvirga pudoricolor TaxID=2778729 RepID=UPI00194E0853|nr:GGDEF domain-containing phosphodiesterase [Microvirga pudoricolor]MBM6592621.1 EAL domain-containing protein [Microvirga pudoricolor]
MSESTPSRWRQAASSFVRSHHLLALAVAGVLVSGGAMTFRALSQPWPLSIPNNDLYLEALLTAIIVLLSLFVARHGLHLRHEIRRRRRAEAAAELSALQDAVTGLPNRTAFETRLAETLTALPRDGRAAVILLEVVGLRDLIDLHGFAVGDEARHAVARRLATLSESMVFRARLEGDGFAFIMKPGLTRNQLAQSAGRIVSHLSRPFEIDGRPFRIGSFLGIASAPADGRAAADLMRAAHVSLGRSKMLGLNTHSFFDPHEDLAVQEHAQLRAELSDAIAGGQIVPYYQPVVDLTRKEINGFEVLARWHHPVLGVLSADRFVSFAEDMDLIYDLTQSIVRQACEEAATWEKPYRLSINLSPLLLQNGERIAHVVDLVKSCSIEPSRLEFEITESAFIIDADSVRRSVELLRSIGAMIVIDDFGSGYSSFYHLREIPFDKVKLDRSFVSDVSLKPRAERFVRAVIRFCASLDLQTTAEGIEDAAVAAKLKEIGCDFGQGYAFSAPVHAGDLASVTESLRARLPTWNLGS